MNKERILKRSKFYYIYSSPVLKRLNEINMPYAIIKSEPLSMYAYSAYGQRIFGDIDILIMRQNLKIADDCLKRSNFYQPITDIKKLRNYKYLVYQAVIRRYHIDI